MKCPLMDRDSLKNVSIFQSLCDDDLDYITRICKVQQYGKKKVIFQEGEPSQWLYIVKNGIVKVSKLSDDGKEQIIRILFPNDFFGYFFLLPDIKHYLTASVIEEAEIIQIYRDDFKNLMDQNKEMGYKYLLAVTEKLYQADMWTGMISLSEVENRIAKLLLYFSTKTNQTVNSFQLPIEKKELASYIGTTAETLSRKLAHFESLNIVELEGRKLIHIKDHAKLQELAGSY